MICYHSFLTKELILNESYILPRLLSIRFYLYNLTNVCFGDSPGSSNLHSFAPVTNPHSSFSYQFPKEQVLLVCKTAWLTKPEI